MTLNSTLLYSATQFYLVLPVYQLKQQSRGKVCSNILHLKKVSSLTDTHILFTKGTWTHLFWMHSYISHIHALNTYQLHACSARVWKWRTPTRNIWRQDFGNFLCEAVFSIHIKKKLHKCFWRRKSFELLYDSPTNYRKKIFCIMKSFAVQSLMLISSFWSI